MALKNYEIKYQTPDITVGCTVSTNADLQQVNQLTMDQINELRTGGEFLTIEDNATGVYTNIKSNFIRSFTVREIREITEPEEIDEENEELKGLYDYYDEES